LADNGCLNHPSAIDQKMASKIAPVEAKQKAASGY
jgi:hypothetical protein